MLCGKQLSVLILCAGLIAPAVPAAAQTAAQKSACRPDVWRLCKRFIPRRAAIISCLAANQSALSPACRIVIMSR